MLELDVLEELEATLELEVLEELDAVLELEVLDELEATLELEVLEELEGVEQPEPRESLELDLAAKVEYSAAGACTVMPMTPSAIRALRLLVFIQSW